MKKIMFICLLLSFLLTPFIDGAYLSCSEDDSRYFCNMANEYEDSKHDINHSCSVCHHAANFQEQINIVIHEILSTNKNLPKPDRTLISDYQFSLYRPPIA